MEIGAMKSNIQLQTEDNYSITSRNIDIYPADYSFPIKQGMIYPDDKLKERADISYTNKLLFNNDYEQVFNNYLSVIPEIDAVYGWQIQDIMSNFPFFKTTVNAYTGLIAGNGTTIDTPDEVAVQADTIINQLNLYETHVNMVKSYFTDPIDLYKVTTDIKGNPVVENIPVKNYVVYNDPENINSVYSIVVSNILTDKVEFIEYKYNGEISKRVFRYIDGVVGEEIGETEYSKAFNGEYDESPLILVKHSLDNMGDTYGYSKFKEFDTAVLAVCRTFMILIRLLEKCKEVMRIVPESSISRTQTGMAMFVNKGTMSYPDNSDKNNRNDMSYAIPELKNNIEAVLATLKQSIKMLSMSSGVSHLFYDFEKAGTGVLSGKALQSMMMPTLIQANDIDNRINKSFKEIIRKSLLLKNIDISVSKIDVDNHVGLPIDDTEMIDVIDKRLSNNTISVEDAIVTLDRVPRRIARERANKILGLITEGVSTQENNDNENVDINQNSELSFTTDQVSNDNSNEFINTENDIIPDYRMPIIPR